MTFKGKLYPYQEEPVERFIHRGSLLLAYAPGTGKTVIGIAAAERLRHEGEITKILILCPASLKYQWQNKIHEFTNSHVTVVDGTKKARVQAFAHAKDVLVRTQYIICSYDSVIYDYAELAAVHPGMVICDEASALKSFRTQRSKKIKKLFKDVPYRMAMTATPIENKPEELYSIMQWVDPAVLGRYDLFDKAYIQRHPKGWISAYKNLDVLRERMGDALARKSRSDPDVKPYLPDVDVDNWTVPLDPKIIPVYQSIADDMIAQLNTMIVHKVDLRDLFHADESTPDGKLMAMHMCLEMLLDHPLLLEWSAQQFEKYQGEYGSGYASYLVKSGQVQPLHDGLRSPKLIVLKQYVDDILEYHGSKIIIFSKYKFMLGIIADYLEYQSVQFNGDLPAKERQERINRFATDPDCKLFISSHAGGYGIDMPMADYLINYDLPMSFGTQDQINSRHIRASSDFKVVYIRNLITEGTIEERNLRRLERKRRISDLAIDGADGSARVQLDADYLRNHLEKFGRSY